MLSTLDRLLIMSEVASAFVALEQAKAAYEREAFADFEIAAERCVHDLLRVVSKVRACGLIENKADLRAELLQFIDRFAPGPAAKPVECIHALSTWHDFDGLHRVRLMHLGGRATLELDGRRVYDFEYLKAGDDAEVLNG